MLHPPQTSGAVHTAGGHQCTLGVKGQADDLASVASERVETAATLGTPQLRGRRGRGRGEVVIG